MGGIHLPHCPENGVRHPVVDPKILHFLAMTGWKPRKGLALALRSTQDKLLDIFGPLTRIFELTENTKVTDQAID